MVQRAYGRNSDSCSLLSLFCSSFLPFLMFITDPTDPCYLSNRPIRDPLKPSPYAIEFGSYVGVFGFIWYAVFGPESARTHLMLYPTTRIFLLTRTGPDILPIHCRSLAAWETEWSMRCRFHRWFQIHSSLEFWRASGPSIVCLTIKSFHEGGLGVIVHTSSSSFLFYDLLFYDFLDICSIFLTFWLYYIYICSVALIYDISVNFR